MLRKPLFDSVTKKNSLENKEIKELDKIKNNMKFDFENELQDLVSRKESENASKPRNKPQKITRRATVEINIEEPRASYEDMNQENKNFVNYVEKNKKINQNDIISNSILNNMSRKIEKVAMQKLIRETSPDRHDLLENSGAEDKDKFMQLELKEHFNSIFKKDKQKKNPVLFKLNV